MSLLRESAGDVDNEIENGMIKGKSMSLHNAPNTAMIAVSSEEIEKRDVCEDADSHTRGL